MSPLGNFPSANPLIILLGYKFPIVFTVFGVEFSIAMPLLQQMNKALFAIFKKCQNYFFFNTIHAFNAYPTFIVHYMQLFCNIHSCCHLTHVCVLIPFVFLFDHSSGGQVLFLVLSVTFKDCFLVISDKFSQAPSLASSPHLHTVLLLVSVFFLFSFLP